MTAALIWFETNYARLPRLRGRQSTLVAPHTAGQLASPTQVILSPNRGYRLCRAVCLTMSVTLRTRLAVPDQHATNSWVGVCLAKRSLGQLQRLTHVMPVIFGDCSQIAR